MSGPALYRYFAGRDELITALIRDAYRSIADTVRAASDSGADLIGLARVIREWARSDPQRYFLIYGTPVPGYQAPDDTTKISFEVMTVLLEVCGAVSADKPATPFDATWRLTGSGPPATRRTPRRCIAPCPSGPACTACSRSNSPATSPA
ncbi:TetR/AcrR family transcriptional regulator [Nonomuraea sp. NPDC049141]|uniref:TetR/AcrR family transcriptional regulator n=1 Tax=Nonomuraea sp. NPDC049141 TaxID=3155500 RepID=UPI0033E84284